MATQDERLETVEYNLRQFKTETVRVYQDMAFEMTMIKGLTEDSIKRLAKLSDTMEKRFERVETRLDGVEIRLDRVETRLDRVESMVETRLDGVETRLDRVESMVETRLDRVESMLAQILARLPEKP
jgi:chaperonin cofactor prefoldin